MAKQIHPIGFSGRLEAIRAPTRGKARKGNTKTNTTLKPPVPQLLGGCAGWLNYNAMLAANKSSETGERPSLPGGGAAGADPTDSLTLFPWPFCHDTTLQHYCSPSVTVTVTKPSG